MNLHSEIYRGVGLLKNFYGRGVLEQHSYYALNAFKKKKIINTFF